MIEHDHNTSIGIPISLRASIRLTLPRSLLNPTLTRDLRPPRLLPVQNIQEDVGRLRILGAMWALGDHRCLPVVLRQRRSPPDCLPKGVRDINLPPPRTPHHSRPTPVFQMLDQLYVRNYDSIQMRQ